MKYKVETHIHDNGTVAFALDSANDNEVSSYKELATYDIYVDVFDSKEEAEMFYKECLEEGR